MPNTTPNDIISTETESRQNLLIAGSVNARTLVSATDGIGTANRGVVQAPRAVSTLEDRQETSASERIDTNRHANVIAMTHQGVIIDLQSTLVIEDLGIVHQLATETNADEETVSHQTTPLIANRSTIADQGKTKQGISNDFL